MYNEFLMKPGCCDCGSDQVKFTISQSLCVALHVDNDYDIETYIISIHVVLSHYSYLILLFCAGTSFAAERCSIEHRRSYHTTGENVTASVLVFNRQFSKDNGSSFYGSGSDPRDPTHTPSSSGGGSGSHGGGGGGDKRDGWLCPNCGELCSHVDLFICESVSLVDSVLCMFSYLKPTCKIFFIFPCHVLLLPVYLPVS